MWFHVGQDKPYNRLSILLNNKLITSLTCQDSRSKLIPQDLPLVEFVPMQTAALQGKALIGPDDQHSTSSKVGFSNDVTVIEQKISELEVRYR